MKPLILLSLILGMSQPLLAAEQLRSEVIKKIVAAEIDVAEWTWSTARDKAERGAIWTVNYSSLDDGTGYMLPGEPEKFSFDVVSKADRDGNGAIDLIELLVSLPCGSEYDESEELGECKVTAQKEADRWTAKVNACVCMAPW